MKKGLILLLLIGIVVISLIFFNQRKTPTETTLSSSSGATEISGEFHSTRIGNQIIPGSGIYFEGFAPNGTVFLFDKSTEEFIPMRIGVWTTYREYRIFVCGVYVIWGDTYIRIYYFKEG